MKNERNKTKQEADCRASEAWFYTVLGKFFVVDKFFVLSFISQKLETSQKHDHDIICAMPVSFSNHDLLFPLLNIANFMSSLCV